MSKLLIAGIDPGTVSAYALLDLDGNIISIGSKREISQGDLILELTKYGKVFAIGSDVYPCPNLTIKISRKIGAKVISPDHNLRYLEKIRIVDSFLKTKKERIEISNKHEKDALAAALYGFRRLKTLMKKIDDHLKENKKEHLYTYVLDKVLIDNIPITDAVKLFR